MGGSLGMSNVLKVSLQMTIYSLADRGWSQRCNDWACWRIPKPKAVNRPGASDDRLGQLSDPVVRTTGCISLTFYRPRFAIVLYFRG